MEKITLKRAEKEGQFEAVSVNGVKAMLEICAAPAGTPEVPSRSYLKAVGGNPNRVLVVQDPLFWLEFVEGAESVEVEFERKTIK
jgi:hypothetical protein